MRESYPPNFYSPPADSRRREWSHYAPAHKPKRPRSLRNYSFPTIEKYEILEQIGTGAYGYVFRARNKATNEIVALKKIKMSVREGLVLAFTSSFCFKEELFTSLLNRVFDRLKFPQTTIREIKILQQLKNHPNIISLKEIVLAGDPKDRTAFMVFEYMDHDLQGLILSFKSFSEAQIKHYLSQILKALDHCHKSKVFHRDIKGSNVLINNKGVVKLADFGLARNYALEDSRYSNCVITLWYRPPELLLGTTTYTKAVDMWSVGCIMAELLLNRVLFKGKDELEQLELIWKVCGTPNSHNWPSYKKLPWIETLKPAVPIKRCLRDLFKKSFPEEAIDLVDSLLTLDPEKRITTEEALASPYFKKPPLLSDPSSLPKYPSTHEYQAKIRQKQASLE